MRKENKPLHMLIVEDNAGDYLLLKKCLQRTDVAIESFHRAEYLRDVETVLKEHNVDLVFLDLTLPDSTGIDSFIDLNRQLPHVPIIVLSGMADMEVALETISLGAQDYLMKGEFDEKLLTKSIHYALERKKILESLRESNERFEIVNKATLDVIWDWNLSTDTLYLSSSVKEMLGYSDQNVTMKWFYERIAPEDAEQVKQSLFKAFENKQNHWSAEFWFQVPGGAYRYIFSRGYTLFDAEGRSYRMIGAATDLTEKRKLEEALVEHQVNQQKLITETTIGAQEKERSELAKELHDNINQILATVKMFLNIARDDASVREDLIDRSYHNVNYAIEEIRKLSKSLITPSLGDIGIAEALQELIEEINMTGGLNAELHYESCPQKKPDPTIDLMLYRIVQEQLNNIVKYAKAGKVRILLREETRNIFMSIADNGVGFDPSKKARGIGLKNISSRVEFYSGKLNIITAPGKGCRLEINIPL